MSFVQCQYSANYVKLCGMWFLCFSQSVCGVKVTVFLHGKIIQSFGCSGRSVMPERGHYLRGTKMIFKARK